MIIRTRTMLGRLTALVAGIALAACGSMMTTAEPDFDPDMDFGTWKTWAWAPGMERPHGVNDLTHARVLRAVSGTFSARGFGEASAADADFLVAYQVFVDEKTQVTSVSDPDPFRHRYGWRSSMGTTRTYVDNYQVGTLVIDLVDRASGNLGWSGSAAAEIRESSSPEERQQRANDAVQAILGQFPPGRQQQ